MDSAGWQACGIRASRPMIEQDVCHFVQSFGKMTLFEHSGAPQARRPVRRIRAWRALPVYARARGDGSALPERPRKGSEAGHPPIRPDALGRRCRLTRAHRGVHRPLPGRRRELLVGLLKPRHHEVQGAEAPGVPGVEFRCHAGPPRGNERAQGAEGAPPARNGVQLRQVDPRRQDARLRDRHSGSRNRSLGMRALFRRPPQSAFIAMKPTFRSAQRSASSRSSWVLLARVLLLPA